MANTAVRHGLKFQVSKVAKAISQAYALGCGVYTFYELQAS